MPPRCQVCTHPRVYLIHEALLAGRPYAAVARQFGLDRNAVMRHVKQHMPDQMRDATYAAADNAGPTRLSAIEGEVLLGQAAEVYQIAMHTLEDLESRGGDQRARVSAIRELRASLEMLAKLSFMIEDRGAGKIEKTGAPEIDRAIIKALEGRLGVDMDPSAARSERPPGPLELQAGSAPAEETG